jgi:hypothetical protein
MLALFVPEHVPPEQPERTGEARRRVRAGPVVAPLDVESFGGGDVSNEEVLESIGFLSSDGVLFCSKACASDHGVSLGSTSIRTNTTASSRTS